MPKRLAIPAPRCPPTVPPRIECASCHRVVLTGCEPAVLWGSQGWCTGCWFQDANRMGKVSQQAPLCGPDALPADCSLTTRFRIARIPPNLVGHLASRRFRRHRLRLPRPSAHRTRSPQLALSAYREEPDMAPINPHSDHESFHSTNLPIVYHPARDYAGRHRADLPHVRS